MDKNTKLGTIEFDKSKTAKIMKFSITSKEKNCKRFWLLWLLSNVKY